MLNLREVASPAGGRPRIPLFTRPSRGLNGAPGIPSETPPGPKGPWRDEILYGSRLRGPYRMDLKGETE